MTGDRLLAVCIPTFRRCQLLRQCLTAVGKLNRPDGHQILVLVVDNDAGGSAANLCTELSNNFHYPLHYFVQAERGLSSVRNRLLREAVNQGADLIAFIDDDEQPAPDWLVQHVYHLEKYHADVCSGPVRQRGQQYELMAKTPKPSGTRPRYVSTNNVLLRTRLITAQGLQFDPFFNFIGGEDFDFFARSSEYGNVHIWVEAALVYETVEAERDNLRYLFYRHFTGGINSILRYRRSHPAWRAWLRFLPKITGKVAGATACFILSCLRTRRPLFFTAVKKLASGLGYFAGLLNVVVERYRNIETGEDS